MPCRKKSRRFGPKASESNSVGTEPDGSLGSRAEAGARVKRQSRKRLAA